MKVLRICVTALFLLVLCIFIPFRLSQRGVDATLPVISVEGEMLHVSLDAGESELLSGVTAYDEKDGDITEKIIVESISRFTEPGVSVVTYAVCDNDSHTATATRKITYDDYTSPRFTLNEPLVFGLYQNINILRRLGAVDVLDGDISDKVIVTAADYTANIAGVYTISAKAANSKGDVISLKLPVYIEDISISAPQITLGSYIVYLTAGEELDLQDNLLSAIAEDNTDLTAQVQIDSDFDNETPGTYQVHYYVSDAAGRRGHTILTVIVEE